MTLLKAIWYAILGLIILLGALIFVGVLAIAWPVVIVLLIFGLPFICVGMVAASNSKKKKEEKGKE